MQSPAHPAASTGRLIRYFDWPLFLNVLIAIALFGVVCIFSATTTSVTEEPATIMEMLETQPTSFARLQFFWLLRGHRGHVRGNVLQL